MAVYCRIISWKHIFQFTLRPACKSAVQLAKHSLIHTNGSYKQVIFSESKPTATSAVEFINKWHLRTGYFNKLKVQQKLYSLINTNYLFFLSNYSSISIPIDANYSYEPIILSESTLTCVVWFMNKWLMNWAVFPKSIVSLSTSQINWNQWSYNKCRLTMLLGNAGQFLFSKIFSSKRLVKKFKPTVQCNHTVWFTQTIYIDLFNESTFSSPIIIWFMRKLLLWKGLF